MIISSSKASLILISLSYTQALDADIRAHLEEIVDQPKEGLILTQVSEPARWIRVRGVHMERIAKFLLSKGL